MKLRSLTVCLSVLALAVASQAGISIDVGSYDFQPDTLTTIAIPVTGGDAVEGLNLYLQLGDGGTDNGGTDTKPLIHNIDLIGEGTIFAGNNNGMQAPGAFDQIWAVSTTTNNGTVTAEGILAYVTIDTTGTTEGEMYDLLLTGVAKNMFGGNGVNSDFAGTSADITNGTINIVPEPATMSLLITGGWFLVHRLKRKQ